MFIVNLVKKENVLELKFICNEVFWTANEFGDDFDVTLLKKDESLISPNKNL